MSVVFGFFLYDYAAGLSLYMITQSLLGIFEQTVLKKIWPIDDTEQPKKGEGCSRGSRSARSRRRSSKLAGVARRRAGGSEEARALAATMATTIAAISSPRQRPARRDSPSGPESAHRAAIRRCEPAFDPGAAHCSRVV